MDVIGRLGLAATHFTVAPLSAGVGVKSKVLIDHVSFE